MAVHPIDPRRVRQGLLRPSPPPGDPLPSRMRAGTPPIHTSPAVFQSACPPLAMAFTTHPRQIVHHRVDTCNRAAMPHPLSCCRWCIPQNTYSAEFLQPGAVDATVTAGACRPWPASRSRTRRPGSSPNSRAWMDDTSRSIVSASGWNPATGPPPSAGRGKPPRPRQVLDDHALTLRPSRGWPVAERRPVPARPPASRAGGVHHP